MDINKINKMKYTFTFSVRRRVMTTLDYYPLVYMDNGLWKVTKWKWLSDDTIEVMGREFRGVEGLQTLTRQTELDKLMGEIGNAVDFIMED